MGSNSQSEDYLASGFRDVDAAAVGKMSRCLTYLDSLSSFQKYKTTILDLMKPRSGSITADLGCGLGFDVQRLSTLVGPDGRAIGVDSSRALLESARFASKEFPSAEFIQADIHSLPLASGLLHSCKVDRALQHVERPAAVVGEMFRTVCPGGTVVCAEPDWDSFAIDTSGLAHDSRNIALQVAELWRNSFRNPRIGSEIKRRLDEAGFVDLEMEQVTLSTPDFASSDLVFDITQSALRLAADRRSDQPVAWITGLRERDQAIPVCCSVTLVINYATRP